MRSIDTGDLAGLIRQLWRYAISGGGAALIYTVVYGVLASRLGVWPILANAIAWLASLISSYILHSRWSFRGHVRNPGSLRSKIRFLIVNVAGLLLNSFWVWLFVDILKFGVNTPLIPILAVTPWLMFYASRKWAFQ